MKKVVKNFSQSLALFLTFTLILPNPSPPQGLGGSLCQRLFSVGDFAFRVENGGQSEITQRLLRTGLEEPQIPPPTIPAAQDQQASLAEAQVALRKLATAYTTYYGAFTDLVHSRRPGIPEELTLAKERILELAGANAEKVNSQLDVYDRNLNRAISDENAKRLPTLNDIQETLLPLLAPVSSPAIEGPTNAGAGLEAAAAGEALKKAYINYYIAYFQWYPYLLIISPSYYHSEEVKRSKRRTEENLDRAKRSVEGTKNKILELAARAGAIDKVGRQLATIDEMMTRATDKLVNGIPVPSFVSDQIGAQIRESILPLLAPPSVIPPQNPSGPKNTGAGLEENITVQAKAVPNHPDVNLYERNSEYFILANSLTSDSAIRFQYLEFLQYLASNDSIDLEAWRRRDGRIQFTYFGRQVEIKLSGVSDAPYRFFTAVAYQQFDLNEALISLASLWQPTVALEAVREFQNVAAQARSREILHVPPRPAATPTSPLDQFWPIIPISDLRQRSTEETFPVAVGRAVNQNLIGNRVRVTASLVSFENGEPIKRSPVEINGRLMAIRQNNQGECALDLRDINRYVLEGNSYDGITEYLMPLGPGSENVEIEPAVEQNTGETVTVEEVIAQISRESSIPSEMVPGFRHFLEDLLSRIAQAQVGQISFKVLEWSTPQRESTRMKMDPVWGFLTLRLSGGSQHLSAGGDLYHFMFEQLQDNQPALYLMKERDLNPAFDKLWGQLLQGMNLVPLYTDWEHSSREDFLFIPDSVGRKIKTVEMRDPKIVSVRIPILTAGLEEGKNVTEQLSEAYRDYYGAFFNWRAFLDPSLFMLKNQNEVSQRLAQADARLREVWDKILQLAAQVGTTEEVREQLEALDKIMADATGAGKSRTSSVVVEKMKNKIATSLLPLLTAQSPETPPILRPQNPEGPTNAGAGLREAMTRQMIRQLGTDLGLANIGERHLAAITPNVVNQNPKLQGLIGVPVSVGDVTVVIVPHELEKIDTLLDSLRGKVDSIGIYGSVEDPVLAQLENKAREKGLPIRDWVSPESLDFRAILKAIIANVSRVPAEAINEETLTILATAFDELA